MIIEVFRDKKYSNKRYASLNLALEEISLLVKELVSITGADYDLVFNDAISGFSRFNNIIFTLERENK